jgi:hypothetical protein
MVEITIKMKSGSTMTVQADGNAHNDSYGSGEKFTEVDSLTCYWPNKGKSKKRRAIPDHLFDAQDAADKFVQALD